MLTGQVDSTVILPEISVNALSARKSGIGSVVLSNNDTSQLIQPNSLADLLGQNQSIYIKSYGVGSLATPAIRGSSAPQTAVIWDGLPITSPMLGQLDLSLINLSLIDNVSIVLGGGSTLWGSGAIGGTIHLDDNHMMEEGFIYEGTTGVASFDRFDQSLKLKSKSGKFSTITGVAIHSSVNNFEIENSQLGDLRQTHNDNKRIGLIQSVGYEFAQDQNLKIDLWYQKSFREIPPTLRQVESLAEQEDQAVRAKLGYYGQFSDWTIEAKLAYFDELLNYSDPAILLESKSDFKSVLADVGVSSPSFNGWTFSFSANTYNTGAYIINYGNRRWENCTNAQFLVHYINNGLSTEIGLRKGIIDTKATPWLPYLAFDIRILKSLMVKGKVTRDFRAPTLNDKYWQPGGNPDLTDERGWSQELSLIYKTPMRGLYFKSRGTVYNRNVSNWIIWVPNETNLIWEPSNLASVWSRGFEGVVDLGYHRSKFKVAIVCDYKMMKSTNQVSIKLPQIKKGQQLFYTPEHQLSFSLNAEWKGMGLRYNHVFVGETLGVNKTIEEYNLGQLDIGYKDVWASHEWRLSLGLKNIWSTHYEVLEFRPMPGRYFEFQLSIKNLK